MTKPPSESLRILLPSYRSDPHTGGQGIYMRLIATALRDLGHRVDVISGPPYPILDEGVNLIKLPSLDLYAQTHPIACVNWNILKNPTDRFEWWSHNWGGFPEPYTFGIRLAQYMKNKINQYDIIHDNQTLCYGLLELQKYQIPIVSTLHHPITMDKRIDIAHAQTPMLKFLKWRWYRFLKMQKYVAQRLPLIAVSDSTKNDVHRDFNVPLNQIHRIYHGIDYQLFAPQPKIKRKNNKIITTASADVPLKGLIYLIRAYAKLLNNYPNLDLLVIGRLREGQTMRELKRLDIYDRVTFRSNLSGHDIRDLYAQATIAVSPSVYEGFGFPAGEALSCGVPLVATNGGALPEVVGNAGIIVPHSNADALADALADLLAHPQKRADLARKARPHILNQFKWEQCAQNVVDTYHTLMQTPAQINLAEMMPHAND